MVARRINLLPPERAQQRRARQITATMVTAGLALVVLLGVVYVAQVIRLHGQTNDLHAQQQKNAALQSQIATLGQFQQLDTQLSQRTTLLKTLTQDEVRWSVVLADISLVIPSEAWLTDFSATQGAAPAQQGAGATASLGSIQLDGITFSHLDVAKWLTRLAAVDAFTNPYLSLSSKSTIGQTPVVSFTSSVELSQQAFRRNPRGAERPL
jgi:Tfp pilus assembly protein PilN